MRSIFIRSGKLGLMAGLPALLAALLATSATGAPLGDSPPITIKDRKGYLPYRKSEPLPKRSIGLIVADGLAVLAREGAYSSKDAMVFARNGMSYRWLYVPTEVGTIGPNFWLAVGQNGGRANYPKVSQANPKTLKPFHIDQPYTLVEVEVNDDRGSPAIDPTFQICPGFVATKIKVLDGSQTYPIKAAEAIQQIKGLYAADQKKDQAAFEKEMQAAQIKAIDDRKATGPRETEEFMFVTWLADKERLRVHFLTKVSDGDYSWEECTVTSGNGKTMPRRTFKFLQRKGTTFGLEFGRAYEMAKDGKLVTTEVLTFQSFQEPAKPIRKDYRPAR